MSNSETGDVKNSQEISKLHIEVEFLSQTVNTLIDLTKDHQEAISAILTHLNDKKEK